MKTLGIIVNIFLPGIGTLFVKKWGHAIGQILLGIIGVILALTGVGSIIGIPLIIGVWIWSIISVVNTDTKPMEVVVRHESVLREENKSLLK